MRYCFDLDGVITMGKYNYPEYNKCIPNEAVIEIMHELIADGATIIIYTARYQEDQHLTEGWLDSHNVPYDFLVLGKPLAEVYIDDKAVQYRSYSDHTDTLKIKLRRLRDAGAKKEEADHYKSRNSSNAALQP